MTKLAVHLHLYYLKQLPLVLRYLCSLRNIDCDLFVTMVEKNPEVENRIKSIYPNAEIWQVQNRGYDIGPFIDFLHHVELDNYQYVLKVHTKGTKSKNYTSLEGRRFDNTLWGEILWNSLLQTPERLTENIQILDNNPQYGILGSKYCLTSSKKNYEKWLPQINNELESIGFNPVNELSFVAGSMFLARANCLKPLKYYKVEDFPLTDRNIKEGTLAHIIERMIGALVANQGYIIKTINDNMSKFQYIYFIYVTVKRFIFQSKVTNSGKKLIKICRIPVYQGLNK